MKWSPGDIHGTRVGMTSEYTGTEGRVWVANSNSIWRYPLALSPEETPMDEGGEPGEEEEGVVDIPRLEAKDVEELVSLGPHGVDEIHNLDVGRTSAGYAVAVVDGRGSACVVVDRPGGESMSITPLPPLATRGEWGGNDVSFCGDGSASSLGLGLYWSRSVVCYDVETAALVASFPSVLPVGALVAAGGERDVYVAAEGGYVSLYDVRDPKGQVASHYTSDLPLYALDAADNILVAAGEDRDVHAHDLRGGSGNTVGLWKSALKYDVGGLHLLPGLDSRLVVARGTASELMMGEWSGTTKGASTRGRFKHSLYVDSRWIGSGRDAASPDSTLMAGVTQSGALYTVDLSFRGQDIVNDLLSVEQAAAAVAKRKREQGQAAKAKAMSRKKSKTAAAAAAAAASSSASNNNTNNTNNTNNE